MGKEKPNVIIIIKGKGIDFGKLKDESNIDRHVLARAVSSFASLNKRETV